MCQIKYICFIQYVSVIFILKIESFSHKNDFEICQFDQVVFQDYS